jgi:hypothetical protein
MPKGVLLPTGAPLPAAPPCIRQGRLPCTGGVRQGCPVRVRLVSGGTQGSWTPRWRNEDSNRWSHLSVSTAGHRPDVANSQHPSRISNPFCQFNQHPCGKWDQRFESAFLQRRVCKFSVPACSRSTGSMICRHTGSDGGPGRAFGPASLTAAARGALRTAGRDEGMVLVRSNKGMGS